ncbi:hypothetical protein SNK47_17525, partial [Escherichia coli]|uniref:hypothetical protein n=1 Tax=Escherichia coli TaxID=562 RepID=UPI002A5A497F
MVVRKVTEVPTPAWVDSKPSVIDARIVRRVTDEVGYVPCGSTNGICRAHSMLHTIDLIGARHVNG